MSELQPWEPEEGEEVRITADQGIFAPITGQTGVIQTLNRAAKQVVVLVHRQPYVMTLGDIEPTQRTPLMPDALVLEGDLIAVSRKLVRLKRQMRERGVVGFGDGSRWRADIEHGLLVVREVAPAPPDVPT